MSPTRLALALALLAAGPALADGPANTPPAEPADPVDVQQYGELLTAPELIGRKTQYVHPEMRDRLVGTHPLTLQWIGWKTPGRVTITDEDGLLRVRGEQRQGRDLLVVDGVLLRVARRKLIFNGTIRTQVTYVNSGRLCERLGTMAFRATGKRRYWRLRQMDNCEGNRVVDYVDLFFKQLAPPPDSPPAAKQEPEAEQQ